MTSTQSALIGNGRLLITFDGAAGVLGASWPNVDSFNQLDTFTTVIDGDLAAGTTGGQYFADESTIVTERGQTRIVDVVLDDVDVWVRRIDGVADDVVVAVVPQLDGRSIDQTIYWDGEAEALLAYHRANWVAVGGQRGRAAAWECAAGPLPELPVDRPLTGERIASRQAHGLLRLTASGGHADVFTAFAATREDALIALARARGSAVPTVGPAPDLQDRAELLRQSRNVIRLLSNRDTGAVIAGPPLPVDIPSEPGYAAVWGRDASWIMLGSLAAGDHNRVRHFLEFAFHVQSPEGLWLHRHHTDYSVGSSWGLHQLDETGIILHLLACYATQTGDWAFAGTHLDGVRRAANFLADAVDVDGLPRPSVDLWEERESRNTYTIASFIGGLRAAALIAHHAAPEESTDRWENTAALLTERVTEALWSEREGRFLKAIESRAALQLDDDTRTDLPSKLVDREGFPETPFPDFPNWSTGETLPEDLAHDISVLGLTVPFGVLPADDPRMAATLQRLQERLWVEKVGGFRRYEGDTYGGGNPWPIATLWVACFEAARGNTARTEELLDWVHEHVGPNNMIAEQVHRDTGQPVAAFPMPWSHGMILLATAAASDQRVWETASTIHPATTAQE